MRSIFFITIGLFFLIVIYQNVKKHRFPERESIFWMLGAIICIFSPLLLPLLNKISFLVGIDYPPALLFLLLSFFLLFLIFRLSRHINIANDKIKELSQQIALLKKEMEKYK